MHAPRSFVEPLVLIAALWALVFGALAWVLARRYDRAASLWAVFGVLLGPLAIAILQVAPPGRCPSCGARVHGWESTCLVCDRPLAGRRRRSAKPADVLEEVLTAPAEAPAEGRASGTGSPAAEPQSAVPPAAGRRRGRRSAAGAARPAPDTGPGPGGRSRAEDPTASGEPARPSPVADPGATTGAQTPTRDRAVERWNAAWLGGRSPHVPAEPIERGRGQASGERPSNPPVSPPAGPAVSTQTAASAEPEASLVVVFVVGSESLVIGARYLLTVEAGVLMVLGPLDTAPGNVRVRRRIEELDVSAVGGQVLVTSRQGPRLALAFNAMPGQHPERLERAVQRDTTQDASA